MPRKITDKMTLEEVDEEILFTGAALAADPDAEGLLPLIANWPSSLETQVNLQREVRRRVVSVDAIRIVANGRLDRACTDFGDELRLDVKKDVTSPRWIQFFTLPVSNFIRQSLPKQVTRVRAWLQSSDPILLKHKPELERWTAKADEALINTRALALTRGEAAIARAQFDEDLTNDRDGLHAALMQVARDKKLGRDWADTFFRVVSRRNGEEEETEATATESAEAP